MEEKRLTFGSIIDRVFWSLLTSSVLYATSQLHFMGQSIEDLNVKVGVMIEKISNAEKRADNFERRLEMMEDEIRKKSHY